MSKFNEVLLAFAEDIVNPPEGISAGEGSAEIRITA